MFSKDEIEAALVEYAYFTHKTWGYTRDRTFEMIFNDVELI